MVGYGLFLFSRPKNWNLYPRNKLHAIPYFPTVLQRMRGRARFQVTTMDSVFAFKVWMFESKDCVLEMTSAKYHVRIELLDVWKNSWNIWSYEPDYEIRRPDVSIVEQQGGERLRVGIEELSICIKE